MTKNEGNSIIPVTFNDEGKMPYTMTHLIIARNVKVAFNDYVKSLPNFYLGSIAPDAVHNRENFIYDHKKESHLYFGSDQWGIISNHNEYKNSVIRFFTLNKESVNYDFILGYCVHVLSDIYHHLTVFTPFLRELNDEMKENPRLFSQESNRLDIELALTYKGREEFWDNLRKSEAVEIPGIIYADEITKQKQDDLHMVHLLLKISVIPISLLVLTWKS